MIALYVGIALLAVSLLEYLGHRFALHRPKIQLGKDHLEHHRLFARDFWYGGEEPAFYDQYWVRGIFGFLWTLPLALVMWAVFEERAGLTVTLIGVSHAIIWQYCHNQMHRPTCVWLQRNPWFSFMRNFHYTHHHKPRTNFAFVFAPVWDWVFGTYRSFDDADEAITECPPEEESPRSGT